MIDFNSKISKQVERQSKQIDDLNEQIARLHRRLIERENDLSLYHAYLVFALMQLPDNKIEFLDNFYTSEEYRATRIKKYRDFQKNTFVIEAHLPKPNEDQHHE